MKRIALYLFIGFGWLSAAVFLGGCSEMILLHPMGPIGEAERFLIIISFALMLIVVLPVFVMVFWFCLRYRASNPKAAYMPKWDYGAKLDWVIWLVPIAIVTVLSYLAWTKTYQLDPYRPIDSGTKPIRIEVVSLDWNWLFIYPDQNIAMLNQIVFPAGVPLSFRLTSDSVMTSFFIPRLGSQMYAMAGMQTRLNLMAGKPGVYTGHNQEFSGRGYADMHFKAIATTSEEFQAWIAKVRQSPDILDADRFVQLRKPITGRPVTFFSSVEPGLFKRVVSTYRGWKGPKSDPGQLGAKGNQPGPLRKAADADHSSPENREEG